MKLMKSDSQKRHDNIKTQKQKDYILNSNKYLEKNSAENLGYKKRYQWSEVDEVWCQRDARVVIPQNVKLTFYILNSFEQITLQETLGTKTGHSGPKMMKRDVSSNKLWVLKG